MASHLQVPAGVTPTLLVARKIVSANRRGLEPGLSRVCGADTRPDARCFLTLQSEAVRLEKHAQNETTLAIPQN